MKHEAHITNILITILLILIIISIFLQLESKVDIQLKIKEAISSIEKPKDGYTPVKGVDYIDGITPIKGKDYQDGASIVGKDGVNGRDGKDSLSTQRETTIIQQVPVNGKDGIDGLTPTMRCNKSKDRWEVKYGAELSWKVVLDEDELPSKCKPILGGVDE